MGALFCRDSFELARRAGLAPFFFWQASQFEPVQRVVLFLTLSARQLSAELARTGHSDRFLGVSKARIFPAGPQLSHLHARRLSAAILCTEHASSRSAGLLRKIQ